MPEKYAVPGTWVLVAVPQRDNRASCKALEEAGFRLIDERDLESTDPLMRGSVPSIYGEGAAKPRQVTRRR